MGINIATFTDQSINNTKVTCSSILAWQFHLLTFIFFSSPFLVVECSPVPQYLSVQVVSWGLSLSPCISLRSKKEKSICCYLLGLGLNSLYCILPLQQILSLAFLHYQRTNAPESRSAHDWCSVGWPWVVHSCSAAQCCLHTATQLKARLSGVYRRDVEVSMTWLQVALASPST